MLPARRARAQRREPAAPAAPTTRKPHLLAEARAHRGAQLADAVDQAELERRAAPVQNSPSNSVVVVALQAVAAAVAHLGLEAVVDVAAGAASSRSTSSGVLRPERVEHAPCARRRCGRAARRRAAAIASWKPKPALITPIEPTIEDWRRRRSRRPRRPASSRPRPRRPRRRRAPARFFSAASARMRSAISADCTGEPPGELITSATA